MWKTSNLLLLTAICVAAAGFASAQAKAKPFYTAGYFDNIHMTSTKSGDYFGLSVLLTQSEDQTFALVTAAEGAIFNPVLVPVTVTGKDMRGIEFTVKDENTERKFKGKVTASSLILSEGTRKWNLKRTCANVYSNIAAGKESGDFGGTQLYVTDSGGTWFALVTTAEGSISAPKLVEAKVTGKSYDRISFTLPGDTERKFTGVRKKTSWTLDEAGNKSVLKLKCFQ